MALGFRFRLGLGLRREGAPAFAPPRLPGCLRHGRHLGRGGVRPPPLPARVKYGVDTASKVRRRRNPCRPRNPRAAARLTEIHPAALTRSVRDGGGRHAGGHRHVHPRPERVHMSSDLRCVARQRRATPQPCQQHSAVPRRAPAPPCRINTREPLLPRQHAAQACPCGHSLTPLCAVVCVSLSLVFSPFPAAPRPQHGPYNLCPRPTRGDRCVRTRGSASRSCRPPPHAPPPCAHTQSRPLRRRARVAPPRAPRRREMGGSGSHVSKG